MIKIIRIHAYAKLLRAGDTYLFEDWSEEKNFRNASNFMWGRDVNDFCIIKDGCEVDLRGISDVEEIYQILKDFKPFV